MKVVFHPEVESDVSSILDFLLAERPEAIGPLQRHIEEAIGRLAVWPQLAPVVPELGTVRALSLSRFPYRIFYRVRRDAIEILHIRHTAREAWEGGR